MIDLTPIFQAIIALLAALVTYKLIPWIKARTTTAQQENLTLAARVAVYAAEQIFGAGKGAEKFEYARTSLQNCGFTFDPALLTNAIEDAVMQMSMEQSYADVAAPEVAHPDVADWTDGTYNKGDVVEHNKMLWVVTTDQTSAEPGAGEEWKYLADVAELP